jgi:hypothetical protein
MIDLFTFILIAYGASNIMVFSTIFAKFRELVGVNKEEKGFFGKLFGCMMCLPFWWGVILSLTIYSPSFAMNGDEVMMFDLPKVYLCAFLDGCLASGSVWLLHTLQEHFEGE